MDPVTGALVIGAVAGIAQAYQAEQARGASKKALQEIKDSFDAIVPPEYDVSITDPPALHEERLRSPEFSDPISAPKFNMAALTPERLKVIGKYAPEIPELVKEQKSQTIQKTGDLALGREAQKAALQRFQAIGAGEFDPEYQEAVTRASRAAQADAQSRQASILQDFARRGQSGSGLNLAAQLGGASQAMDREAMANLGAASESYRNRLNALSQGAQLGGNIAEADTALQSRNADIINSFNQRMSSAQQQYNANRANLLNEGQRYNLGVEQGLSNQNIAAANDAARYNQGRADELAKYGYSAQTAAQARDDANRRFGYGANVDERNYANQLAQQKYNTSIAAKDRSNDLLAQQYADKVNKQKGAAGIAGDMIQNTMGAAQDRNAAIGALGQLGQTYYQSQAASDASRKGQLAADDRSFYEKTGQFMDPETRSQRQKDYDEYY